MIARHVEAPEVFLLLDANVVSAYYIEESSSNKKLRARITTLMEAVRNGGAPYIFLYTPEFCVAEVFGVFDKYRFGPWNRDVKTRAPRGIPKRRYEEARKRFSDDVSRRRLLHPCDISRYHVMAVDLISPVDHYYQYYRPRPGQRLRKPMGTYDHMIIALGIHLNSIHGRENFAIVTADGRLAHILDRARRVPKSTAGRLELPKAADRLGLSYGPDIYPRVVNLATCGGRDLAHVMRVWPLPQRALALDPSPELDQFKQALSRVYGALGVDSDRLPYTSHFETLHTQTVCTSGVYVGKSGLWKLLLKMRKLRAGGLPAFAGKRALAGGRSRVDRLRPRAARLYRKMGVPLDRLPYTAEFEMLYSWLLFGTRVHATRSDVWDLLLNMRKAGELPVVGRRALPRAEAEVGPAPTASSA